jgi:hypothetical protein
MGWKDTDQTLDSSYFWLMSMRLGGGGSRGMLQKFNFISIVFVKNKNKVNYYKMLGLGGVA